MSRFTRRRLLGHSIAVTGIAGFAYAFHAYDMAQWRQRHNKDCVTLDGGGKMHVRYTRAYSDSRKPLVVLFQPLGSSALEMRGVQEALETEGYSSVAVDRGCSGLSSLGVRTPTQSIHDIDEALHRVVPNAAAQPRIVVGCWDGAQVAQLYALAHPNDVKSKVFMAPMGPQRLWATRGRHESGKDVEAHLRSLFENQDAAFRQRVKDRGEGILDPRDAPQGFQGKDTSTVKTLRSLASLGLLRLMRSGFIPYPGVPDADKPDVIHHFLCVGTYDQLSHEWTPQCQMEYETALHTGWQPSEGDAAGVTAVPTYVYEPSVEALERTMSSAPLQALYSNAWLVSSFTTDFLATSTAASLVSYDGGLNPHLTEPHVITEAVVAADATRGNEQKA